MWGVGGRWFVPHFESEINGDSRVTFDKIFPGLAGLVGPILENIFLACMV